MTDGVTYTELRFCAPPQNGSKVDVTYENVDCLRPAMEDKERIEGEKHPAPAVDRNHPWVTWLRRSSSPLLCLFLLLLCLTLLLGLTLLAVKYVQQSSYLNNFHTATHSLTQDLQICDKKLSSFRKEIMATRAELDWAVRENSGLNDSLNQCQQEVMEQTNRSQEAKRKIDQWENDLCPQGWVLFKKKCLWFSTDTETWYRSRSICQGKDSNLIVLLLNDVALKDFLSKKGDAFWVGHEWSYRDRTWKWPSGYPYQDIYYYYTFSQGNLESENYSSNNQYRFICEKTLVATSQKSYPGNVEFTLSGKKFSCPAR